MGIRIGRLVLALVLLLGAGPMSAGQAHEGHRHQGGIAKFGLKFRLSTMQAMGVHMGLLLAETRGEIELDAARRRTHGAAVHALSRLLVDLFQNETWQRTRAKREIWLDWEKFAASVQAMETASGKLALTTTGDDLDAVKAAIDATGQQCTCCHKAFRKPKH